MPHTSAQSSGDPHGTPGTPGNHGNSANSGNTKNSGQHSLNAGEQYSLAIRSSTGVGNRSAAPSNAIPPAGSARVKQEPTVKVLLVDPDPQVGADARQALHPGTQLVQVDCLSQAREQLAGETFDLLLVQDKLRDGQGLNLAQEMSRARPGTPTIMLTGKPDPAAAISVLRSGAVDLLIKPLEIRETAQRLRLAIQRGRQQRRHHNQVRKLRRTCHKLMEAREQVTQQVDVLCNDLVNAYQELATQMQQVVQSSELSALLRQELDLEQLIRKVLEYLLEKAGPTNAALFLPANEQEYALGGYVNYDCTAGTPEVLLQHLADVLAPRIASQPTTVHVTDNDALKHWLGDDWNYLADCHLLAITCRHQDQVLAVLALFRDSSQRFEPVVSDTLTAIGPLLGEYLARIVRVHHRSLPD